MARALAEIAFTPAVKAVQSRHGSRRHYAAFEAATAPRRDRLGPKEQRFIGARDGFYQASVNSAGWPYVQFRGGPAGFLHVLDDQTVAYADFSGNRQYLSAGNLSENDRIALILMDYAKRQRLKLWGEARLIAGEDDPALVATLACPDYAATIERAVVIRVAAFDWNCPQHITRRFSEAELAPLSDELAALRAENQRLRAKLAAARG